MNENPRAAIMEQLKDALDRASNGKAKLTHVSEDALIVDDLGLYSLDLLDLRYEVEDIWNLSIADEEMMSLRKVSDVIDLIVERGPAT